MMNGLFAVVEVEYIEVDAIGVFAGTPCFSIGVTVGFKDFLSPTIVDHNGTARVVIDAVDGKVVVDAIAIGGEYVGNVNGAIFNGYSNLIGTSTAYVDGVDVGTYGLILNCNKVGCLAIG